MTINDAAKRAATKIRDAMPWSMTDESFEELVNEIAAEFSELQEYVDAIQSRHNGYHGHGERPATPKDALDQLIEESAAIVRKEMQTELDRLRGLLAQARSWMSKRAEKAIGADIDAALKGATE